MEIFNEYQCLCPYDCHLDKLVLGIELNRVTPKSLSALGDGHRERDLLLISDTVWKNKASGELGLHGFLYV